VVYGSNIDNAVTETGKPYSNYRKRFATRNEWSRAARVTARIRSVLPRSRSKGLDASQGRLVVAGSDGLMVAGRGADKRGAALNLSPASEAVRARYQRVPVVASE